MNDTPLRKRDAVARSAGLSAEMIRGSLLHRTIRHNKGCLICAKGGGHPVLVLSVNYPGGRNKQVSIRPDQKAMVERWLRNYHTVKDMLEAICELNLALLRPKPD